MLRTASRLVVAMVVHVTLISCPQACVLKMLSALGLESRTGLDDYITREIASRCYRLT